MTLLMSYFTSEGVVMQTIRVISAIKAARNALGWSQPDLAKRAGVSLVTLARTESGAINPRMSSLIAIQKAIEAAGIIIQDNSPVNGYTLIMTAEAMTVAEQSLSRISEGREKQEEKR
jgi:predicted transcriptional regulator